MFDHPDTKRVRRAELQSPDSTRRSSPGTHDERGNVYDAKLQQILKEKMESLFGTVGKEDVDGDGEEDEDPNTASYKESPNNDTGYEFRLFAPIATQASSYAPNTAPAREHDDGALAGRDEETPAVTRILLDDDLEGNSHGGGFLGKGRGDEYYFAATPTTEVGRMRRARFETVAVSGEGVRRGLRVRYTGLALPWRVRVLRVTSARSKTGGKAEGELGEGMLEGKIVGEECGRRKRPGKKRRVKLRTRMKALEEEKAKEKERRERKQEEDREKEEKWRENKTRKNRMKQIKKRAKDKEKARLEGGGELMPRSGMGSDGE